MIVGIFSSGAGVISSAARFLGAVFFGRESELDEELSESESDELLLEDEDEDDELDFLVFLELDSLVGAGALFLDEAVSLVVDLFLASDSESESDESLLDVDDDDEEEGEAVLDFLAGEEATGLTLEGFLGASVIFLADFLLSSESDESEESEDEEVDEEEEVCFLVDFVTLACVFSVALEALVALDETSTSILLFSDSDEEEDELEELDFELLVVSDFLPLLRWVSMSCLSETVDLAFYNMRMRREGQKSWQN
jgi:hypothetical protein